MFYLRVAAPTVLPAAPLGRQNGAGPVAPRVDYAKETELAFRTGAQLMWLVGADVDNVEGPQLVIGITYFYPPAATYTDNHMTMAMVFATGEAAAFEFKVTQVKFHWLAAAADDYLARGPAELAAAMRRKLVRLELHALPSEARKEAPHHQWRVVQARVGGGLWAGRGCSRRPPARHAF